MKFDLRKLICVVACVLISSIIAQADPGVGRHKKMYPVPAPGKVVIDGKLDDWDLSAQILTYVETETSETQSAKFALMYDKDNLYLSAVVRDTTPMMNRHDPLADGSRGWNADACQFRISLDPKLPYPLPFAVYTPEGRDNRAITHLTMWYYTDKQEPALQIYKSMAYQFEQDDWGPFGVVPKKFYQAKYLKAADGLGYTFEYAIPWSTLGAKTPLKGGDITAGTVQFNYGAPNGLKTAGVAAWCYDVMARAGTTYQNTSCWGKLLFSAKGHLPSEMVEEGVPPVRALPLKFKYNLPEDSQITIQIMDKDHAVQRILVPQAERRAGENVELWDGLNYAGKPLPAGTYTWKGIYHKPLTQKVLFSPMNSGQPPYQTDDGTGSWGGDHGYPRAAIAFDDGVILGWDVAECGSGIIRTDFNGRKKWGTLHCASYMATDGKRIFAAGDIGFDYSDGISVLSVVDCKPLSFGNGNSHLLPPDGPASTKTVSGVAYAANTVFVSYRDRNYIAVYDATSGDLKGTWPIAKPGQLAGLANGSLIGVSDGKLMSIKENGASPFSLSHVDDPRGIAVGPDGSVYVANAGVLQNISVYDPAGNYLRGIGKEGGRPAVGHYDPSGILDPGGIALDRNGHLWVAELLDSPKRFSEWDVATGKLVNEFFGGCSYFGYSYIDPKHPDEIYCHNVLWKIDWAKNTCAPVSTVWRSTKPNMMEPQGPAGYNCHPVYFTAKNGHQYCYGGAQLMTILSYRVGDLYKPCAAFITVARGAYFGPITEFPLMQDEKKYPNGNYFWQDKNDDQIIQDDELVPVPAEPQGFGSMDENLDVGLGTYTVSNPVADMLSPVSVEPDGRPVYDLAHRIPSPWPRVKELYIHDSWRDTDGGLYTHGESLARYSPTGQKEWSFPGMIEWPQATGLPIQAPGRLWGLTNHLGMAGEFTGCSDYFGTYHIFDREGDYVGMLMRDSRGGGGFGPDVTASEVLTGQLVKPDGMDNRYFLLAGASDARVTEIFGLDTVKHLPGGTLTLTDTDVKLAAAAVSDYNVKLARGKRLAIVRGLPGLETAEAVTQTVDSDRDFKVKAAYDNTNLYLAYEVDSPSDLVNGQPDPRILFKGGNCLDIQIATDTTADPKRKTAAPGDVRILVTRQSGKTVATLYQPKINGFTGTPITLTSPANKEDFDSIETTDKVALDYKKTASGYNALVTIPLDLIGLTMKPGQQIRMDLGVVYGNDTGNRTTARSYWMNDGFAAHATYDVPTESRLEPAEWGLAVVE